MHEIKEIPVKAAVVVTSDHVTERDDLSGKLIMEELKCESVSRTFCRNDFEEIKRTVKDLSEKVDAIVVSGGTGVGRRDVSVDAVRSLLEKELPGFGEIFRRVSFEKIGFRAVLSRACAGTVGSTVVFCIPGSPDAARTAVRIINEILNHAVYEVKHR